MEENKEVMNTEQAGSGGMLYGTEPQPQEELYGTSAAYGTEMQAQQSELSQPEVLETAAAQPIPVQLSKTAETVEVQMQSEAAQQPEMLEAAAAAQSVRVELSKTSSPEEIQMQSEATQQPIASESAVAQPVRVELSKASSLEEIQMQSETTQQPEMLDAAAQSVPVQQPTVPQPVPVQLSKVSSPADAQIQPQLLIPEPAAPQQQPVPPFNPGWSGQQPQQGSFYQQGSGQPMNTPMGFGPVQTPPPVQGAPVPKQKKRRTGLIAGVLCAAAVAIFIVVGVLLSKALFGGGGAKAQLAKGFANMAMETAAYRSAVAEDLGLSALNKMKAESPIHTNMDLSFTDPNEKGTFNSIDLEIDAVSDYKKKLGEYAVSAGTYGIHMSIGNIVAADNTLYITVPILFKDKIYSIDLSNLGNDFNDSAWSELIGEKLPEDYALTLFESPSTAANIKEVGTDSELYKIMSKHGRTIANAMTVEKLKGMKEEVIAHSGVRLIVDKDAYNKAAQGMRDDILASDFYEESQKGYQNIYGIRYGEDMDRVIECMFDMRFEQDLLLDFYFDKKGRIINISTPEDMAVSGEHTDVDSVAVDIDFSGRERALDLIDGGVYLQAGEEIIFMGISRDAEITDEYYSEDLTFSIQRDNSDEEIVCWFTNLWGYEDHTFDMQMGLKAVDELIGFRADGSFVNIVKEKGCTVELDHAAVFSEEEDLLLMTGSITTEQTQNKIEVPEKAENLLEMTSKDIQELFYDALF